MTHNTVAKPTVVVKRRFYELRADIVDAPPFIVGRYGVDIHGIAVIYRLYDAPAWEFIHATLNGVWLDGDLQGKSAHRKYGRMTIERLPTWLITFINDNIPEIEDTES